MVTWVARCSLQPVFEIAHGGGVFGRGALQPAGAAVLAELARDHPFGRAHGRALPQNFFREQALFVVRFQSEQHLGVPDGEQILHDPGLDLRVEIEQAHRVRDRGPALPDLLRDVFLAHPKFVRQPRVGLRFLDRVEIGALQVFDQRQLEHFQVGRLPNDGGRFAQAGFLGRAPAAFAGDELELVVDLPNDKRLDDAALPDGIDQLLERFALKFPARLERAGDDAGRG